MLRVVINGLRNGTNDSFAVVVKMPPDSPERRNQFSAVLLFEREAMFYDKYWPMLVQFQADRGITAEEAGFFAVPKCYKIVRDLERENYAMILEDLVHSGFNMFNKMDVIDVDHVTIFLRHLARYHALSFAMRDQQPEMFREIQTLNDMFSEVMIKKTPNFEMMIQAAVDKAIGAVEPHKEFKIEKLQKLRREAIQIFEFCGTLEKCEPFGVLMHGDCWNNNMMYRYGGVSGSRKNSFFSQKLLFTGQHTRQHPFARLSTAAVRLARTRFGLFHLYLDQ
jgi:Ecdysteroid kinase-like family